MYLVRISLDRSVCDDVRKEVELRKWFTEPVVYGYILCFTLSQSLAIPALFEKKEKKTGLWKYLLIQSSQMLLWSILLVGQVLIGMVS